MIHMKKIYLEKQFMKATGLNNYIIGEIIAHSKENGRYQIKKEGGNILTVFSHSILGWEEYKENKEAVYEFRYYAKELDDLSMFYCDLYKNGELFYKYSYDVNWAYVFNSCENFRHFLTKQGIKTNRIIDESWYNIRDKEKQGSQFELYIEKLCKCTPDEKVKQDVFYLVLRDNQTKEEEVITSTHKRHEIEHSMHIMAKAFTKVNKDVKVHIGIKERESTN